MKNRILIWLKIRGTILSVLLLVLSGGEAGAQENIYRINANKDNLSWIWLGQLQLNYQTGDKSSFMLQNHFSSNLFRKTIQGDRWRDDNDLISSWIYRFNNNVQASTKLKSNVFAERNRLSRFSKHLIMEEILYQPSGNIQLKPALGFTYEDIYGFQDQGWYTRMEVKVRNYDLSGYTNSTDANSSLFFFPDRRNQEHRYFVAFHKKFSNQASDSIRVGYEFIENSYPVLISTLAEEKNLEKVGINTRFLYNELIYRLSDQSFFNVQTELQTRDASTSNPELHNHREEVNFANRFGIQHLGAKFQSGFIFSSSQQTSLSTRIPISGIESRTDIDGLQAAFNFFLNWFITPRDESRLTFSYTKYEYSSPDTTQTIDEDDLRFIIDFRYRHLFSPYFALTVKTNLYLYHQIYIHQSRSANNNWNRIFQLAPSFWFSIPNVLVHTNQIKILANYTVYDFEDVLPEVRSYIFRKLIYSDSLSIFLTGNLKFNFTYQLEKGDNGTFFKDIFAEQISREIVSHFIDLGLVYTRIQGIQLITAFNWQIRREWNMFPVRRQVRDYYSFGPRMAVNYNMNRRLLLSVDFSPRIYRDFNIVQQYYTMARVNLNYLF